MATGANVTVEITGVDKVRAKLERIKWDLVDGREVLSGYGHRRRVLEVLELGAIPDDRLLAAAHLERFVAGCPANLFEWTPGPAMQAGAFMGGARLLGPKYQSLIDQDVETVEIMAKIAATRATPAVHNFSQACEIMAKIAATRATPAVHNFSQACYDLSLELATAADQMSEGLGRIGIVVGSTKPVGSPAWQRDQLLWYGYPDWTPGRVDDWLFRFYGWLPDEAIKYAYKVMLR